MRNHNHKKINFYLSTSSASGGAAGVLFNWPETSPAPRHRTLGVALALGLSGFPPHLLLHVAALLGDGRIPSIVPPCDLRWAWCWGRRRGNCGRVKVCKDTRRQDIFENLYSPTISTLSRLLLLYVSLFINLSCLFLTILNQAM